MFLEISAKAVIVNNLIARNQMEGAKINNTSDVRIWNNTFVGNVARPLYLPQDTRRNTNSRDQAVDPRQPFPDPTMPWTLGPITLRNNVVAQTSGAAQCLLCVEDYGYKQSAESMGVSSDGNIYQRTNTGTPQWLVVWSSGSTNPLVFTSLSAFSTRRARIDAARSTRDPRRWTPTVWSPARSSRPSRRWRSRFRPTSRPSPASPAVRRTSVGGDDRARRLRRIASAAWPALPDQVRRSSMPRSVLVANPSADVYGSDRMMVEAVRGLVADGCEVVVTASVDGPLRTVVEAAGARFVVCPSPVVRKSHLSPRGLVQLAGTVVRGMTPMSRLVREVRPDVIYVNTMSIPMWLVLATAMRVPSVNHVHEAENR